MISRYTLIFVEKSNGKDIFDVVLIRERKAEFRGTLKECQDYIESMGD